MGRLGFFLIRVVVWATDRLSQKPERLRPYLVAGVAHAALAGVTAIGSTVDWLTLRTSRPDRDRLRIDRAPATR
jgi:hypothetical protein